VSIFDEPYAPTADLVGVAFLRDLAPELVGSIATTPPERSKWTRNAFVTVRNVSPLGTNPELARRRSDLLDVDVWASVHEGTSRPLWGMATQVAEALADVLDGGNTRTLDLGDKRHPVVVFAGWASDRPQRIEDDPGGHARMTFGLRIDWAADRAPASAGPLTTTEGSMTRGYTGI
jgi:hypothetical protein